MAKSKKSSGGSEGKKGSDPTPQASGAPTTGTVTVPPVNTAPGSSSGSSPALVEPKPVQKENVVRWLPRDLLTGCPRVQINEREYYVTCMTKERWLILSYLNSDNVPVCHRLKVAPRGYVSMCTCPAYRVATGCKHTKGMSRALKSNLSPIKFHLE